VRLFSLIHYSVDHPRTVLLATAALTLVALLPFPRIRTDTNPKNMLPPTSAVRVRNAEVERTFGLYEDVIVVGIRNEGGLLNAATLDRIRAVTEAILAIPGVAAEDVTAFSSVTNVTNEAGGIVMGPLMARTPRTPEELESLRKALMSNRLLADRMVSRDGKTAAIYVPLERGANGKAVADRIRSIVRRQGGSERYYVAGDPVARDTFGAEMFTMMGLFSPIAGAIMFLAVYRMFRSLAMACAMMGVATVAIVWSIGALVALGLPVHIMSSMSPVFLMAIATDSVHIFNEFSFRRRETSDRRSAVLATMEAVGRPVRSTALATAAGFCVLLLMSIVPVRIFGGVVAFGTLALRLLSFSFIPAVLTLLPERSIGGSAGAGAPGAVRAGHPSAGRGERALRLVAGAGARRPRLTLAVAGFLALLAGVGASRITVNNNLVDWFPHRSDLWQADRVLNAALGGTSVAYIEVSSRTPEFFKTPEGLRTLEALQQRLERLPVVGKTFSLADYMKRTNRVFHEDDPKWETLPAEGEAIGQYLFILEGSARASDVNAVVDPSLQKANVTVQLRSWDASAMRQVLGVLKEVQASAPAGLTFTPAGTAYFNLVWNDEVLWDMVRGFLLALVVVFALLVLTFRSLRWAVVGYVPLLLTVLIIYGVIGWAGKDFDMPIAVLSCLSLGMAVDFSIHFIGRFQEHLRERAPDGGPPDKGAIIEALLWTAARPGRGILRNALLFAGAFSVMLFAPLTPYVTVGAFIVAMMLTSALLSLVLLPALIVELSAWLLGIGPKAPPARI
jgi:predicted RND superfamily exporter protein